MTYLITFACYGCHLHGDESGSVDREHNLPGCRLVAGDLKRVSTERGNMDQSPYSMDGKRREAVLGSLLDHCSHRNWSVLAAHVRSTPCSHCGRKRGSAGADHERRIGLDEPARKRWARHGSTRWLLKAENVSAAVRYVVDKQGEPMSVFEASVS